jgi:putative transposase
VTVVAQLSPEAKAALVRQHLDDGVPLTRLAAAAGLPVRTVRRWAATYRTARTLTVLRRQPRNDLGRRRLSEDLVEAIEALALRRPPPTTAYVHRRVADLACDRGVPAPSYSTVRSIVAAIDPGLRTLAHQGHAAYRDQFELVHRRTARPVPTSTGRPTTPCWTCRSWTPSDSRPGRG